MIIRFFINISIICLFLTHISGSAQETDRLEQELAGLEKQKNELVSILNYQQERLNDQLTIIDKLKSQKAKNENTLRSALSVSKSLSDSIVITKASVRNADDQIKALKKRLRLEYSRLIESGDSYSDSLLTEYHLRRLELSPQLHDLSFDPRKIQKADPDATGDSLEKKIMKNYLELAVTDIDSNLKIITEAENDIRQQLSFNEKTERFLDNISDRPSWTFTIETETQMPESERGTYGDPIRAGNIIKANSNYYISLINIVAPYLVKSSDQTLLHDQEITSMQEYLDLVQKTREYLILYKKQIRKKLER
ncbi:MAG: hypothetical protein JXR46_05205 [Calditrichaceae bacterium]|nr:hypothetical protein [Calditrichaceae bacterium]MBN2708423.1 hypothetical protein [Calditrichaceae bacterium]RQV93143.1 MAG: hypothetical protein EH224_13180 [Calditrichota bacterium]